MSRQTNSNMLTGSEMIGRRYKVRERETSQTQSPLPRTTRRPSSHNHPQPEPSNLMRSACARYKSFPRIQRRPNLKSKRRRRPFCHQPPTQYTHPIKKSPGSPYKYNIYTRFNSRRPLPREWPDGRTLCSMPSLPLRALLALFCFLMIVSATSDISTRSFRPIPEIEQQQQADDVCVVRDVRYVARDTCMLMLCALFILYIMLDLDSR